MKKKRFIAGAVCPRCSEMDKLVMFDDEAGQRFRECVSCGFSEQLKDQPEMLEPLTRVNKGMVSQVDALNKHDEAVDVVKIIDLEDKNTLH